MKITIDATHLKAGITAMKATVPEGWVYLTHELAPDGTPQGYMFMKGKDTANVAITECKLKCTLEDPIRNFPIDFGNLEIDASGNIELEEVGNQLVAHVGRINYKVPLLHPSALKEPPSPVIPFPFIFDIPASELHMGLKAVVAKIDLKNHEEAVEFSWDGNNLILQDSMHSKVDVNYEATEINVRKPVEGKVVTLIPTDYIKPILSTISGLERCVVGFGQEFPITIGGTSSVMGYGCIISNRVVPKGGPS